MNETAVPAPRIVHVAVAVIADAQGRILLSRRLPHQHLPGMWEFPGGKLEPGESLDAGLRREIREELGVVVGTIAPLMQIRHDYPGKKVLLDVWRVLDWQGTPYGVEGQLLRWQLPEEMDAKDFPPADVPIIEALRLPPRYVISPDLVSGEAIDEFVAGCLRVEARLLQVRLRSRPQLALSLPKRLRAVLPSARILVNSDTLTALGGAEGLPEGFDGIHLTAAALRSMAGGGRRPVGGILAVSCHDEAELGMARACGADFVTISPVSSTASHPGAPALGWPAFARLAARAAVPVYALGGLSMQDLPLARASGAIGVAGISGMLVD